jgi:putative copper export protein
MLFLQAAQQAAEPLLTWSDPVHELVGFLGIFGTIGAAGFYFFVLRPGLRGNSAGFASAARSAARIGLLGVLLRIVALVWSLAGTMSAKHLSLGQAIARGHTQMVITLICTALMLIGFALAAGGARNGAWWMAAIGALAAQLVNITSGKWATMVNPLHVLFASLWIGTLFVLFAAALPLALRGLLPQAERGPAVASLVNRFSTLALGCGGLLVITGVITAWRHLKTLPALWTTPYGYALIVKLLFVAIVFALGAFNWRGVRPTLSTEGTAHTLHRSARAELSFALIVLVVTAVLVSLPSPGH